LIWFAPIVLVFAVVINAVNIWTFPSRVTNTCPADTLLVMGAAQYNGTPSPAFQRRLDKAFELYQTGCALSVVVSGGKQDGDRTSEGQAGITYLAGLGVPANALKAETTSETSFENLNLSLPFIRDTRLIIVTDDMHSYRTWWLSRHLHLDASVAPVTTGGAKVRYAFRELVILTAYELGIIR
jgi:uncharacterized SAM-binding protein YcdF (DUF218 family)